MTTKRAPSIKAGELAGFVAPYPPSVQTLVRAARRAIRRLVPGVREQVDRGAHLLGYSLGPGYSGVVCVLIPSREGLKLGLPNAAALPDPAQLLEGSGRRHRHIRLRTAAELRSPALEALLVQAAAAGRAALAPRSRRPYAQ